MTDQELERKVAAKVMGWKLTQPGMYWDGSSMRYLIEIKEKREAMKIDDHPNLFAPTSDPVAWMQVVERMQEQGFAVEIRFRSPGVITVSMCKGPHAQQYLKEDDDVGRAICITALEAVEN